MRPSVALALVLALATALPAIAGERKLTGDEIHRLLAGNSVYGMWGQSEYKSYFDAGGSTVYHAKGRDPDTGSWRTTADQYCSAWRGSESCYDLYQDGEKIIWSVPGTADRYSSELIKGDDTNF